MYISVTVRLTNHYIMKHQSEADVEQGVMDISVHAKSFYILYGHLGAMVCEEPLTRSLAS